MHKLLYAYLYIYFKPAAHESFDNLQNACNHCIPDKLFYKHAAMCLK